MAKRCFYCKAETAFLFPSLLGWKKDTTTGMWSCPEHSPNRKGNSPPPKVRATAPQGGDRATLRQTTDVLTSSQVDRQTLHDTIAKLNSVITGRGSDRAAIYLAYSQLGNAYEKLGEPGEAYLYYVEALKFAQTPSEQRTVEIFIRHLERR